MKRQIVTWYLPLCVWASATSGQAHAANCTGAGAAAVVAAILGLALDDPQKPAGSGERVVRPPPAIAPPLTAAERALLDAMNGDPTYAVDGKGGVTQEAAIAGWRRFLEREDLAKEQRGFAWWRIASLYAYNFDPSRNETADFARAEEALKKARELLSEVVGFESLNSATVNAGLPGPSTDRAQRLAESFKWIFTRGEKDIDASAERVSDSGDIVDAMYLRGKARRTTVLQRKECLRRLLTEYREFVTHQVTEYIQYSQDSAAVEQLLKSIESVAGRKQMDQWRSMEAKLHEAAQGHEEKHTGVRGGLRVAFITLNGLLVLALVAYAVLRRLLPGAT